MPRIRTTVARGLKGTYAKWVRWPGLLVCPRALQLTRVHCVHGARCRACFLHARGRARAHSRTCTQPRTPWLPPPLHRRYLTPQRALLKLLAAPFARTRFFDSDGNATYMSEHERIFGKGAKATARKLAAARSRKGALQLAYSITLAAAVALCLAEASSGAGGGL